MKNCVFVHTNERQMVGALVSQYSLRRNSAEDMLREEMRRNHVRHDAFEVIERTPPLAGLKSAA